MSQTEFDRYRANPGASANPNAGDAPLPVPPPPPPRSSPPPVRTATERPESVPSEIPAAAVGESVVSKTTGQPANGVGAARGIRWRGELEQITKQADDESAQSDESTSAHDAQTIHPDRVSREAPPWLVSLVFHLILLLSLALISSPAGTSIGSVMLSLGQSEHETPVELTEFSVSEVATDSDEEMFEEVEPEPVSVFDAAQLSEVENIEPIEIGSGPLVAADQPMFDGRTGAMKQALMAIYGGTTETQEAVELGLKWLKKYQTKDGSWSLKGSYRDGAFTESRVAATSMALLAFMGDGHTHQRGKYKVVVKKGIEYLVSKQDRQGFFPRNGSQQGKMYAQAQATIAICELYGMTQDSSLRDSAQQAINFAVSAQSAPGGWRYEPKVGSDTSVTGWFVMALKSAQAAGLEVDRYVLLNVGKFLDSVQSYDGAAYAYQRFKDPSPSMTAEGLLCRQYTGWQRNHPPLRNGISALMTDSPFDPSDHNVYYWYYATQVLHHYGGEPWKEWNKVMSVELPKMQIKHGKEQGSWPPQGDLFGNSAGRLYTTCLSIYCLEVYYRHMPLYQSPGK